MPTVENYDRMLNMHGMSEHFFLDDYDATSLEPLFETPSRSNKTTFPGTRFPLLKYFLGSFFEKVSLNDETYQKDQALKKDFIDAVRAKYPEIADFVTANIKDKPFLTGTDMRTVLKTAKSIETVAQRAQEITISIKSSLEALRSSIEDFKKVLKDSTSLLPQLTQAGVDTSSVELAKSTLDQMQNTLQRSERAQQEAQGIDNDATDIAECLPVVQARNMEKELTALKTLHTEVQDLAQQTQTRVESLKELVETPIKDLLRIERERKK